MNRESRLISILYQFLGLADTTTDTVALNHVIKLRSRICVCLIANRGVIASLEANSISSVLDGTPMSDSTH